MTGVPYLSEEALGALGLTTLEVVDGIEAALRGQASGSVWSAPKAVITPGDRRYIMSTLGVMDEPPLLAVKSLVVNPDNPAAGLPQINGLVTLLDSRTGLPAAILDANWITAVRTAGLSAVAARRMADPAASSVGFVGCGVQARSHLAAFAEMFPLKRIKLFGRGRANADRLAAEAEALGLDVARVAAGQEAVEDVDIVVTSITMTDPVEPFLDAARLKPGAFAAITDLGVPWMESGLAALDCVVIDDLEQEAAMENKLCDPSIVRGDLSGLALGEIEGRASAADRTAFLFRGHAIGDLALSVLALQKYRAV